MDIALVDGLSGAETAAEIRPVDGDVFLVFWAESPEGQAEAIHHHVFDYRLKSEGREAVFLVLDRILRRQTETDGRLFPFTLDRTAVSLPFDDLVYLSADRNYLVIHDCRGTEYRTRMTFSAARALLVEDARFVQILRGVLVNLDYVTDVSADTCFLRNSIRLPVSIRNRERIDRLWANYQCCRAGASLTDDTEKNDKQICSGS